MLIMRRQTSLFSTVGDLTNELVRHFLIETSAKGVRLKGCPNEPYFGERPPLFYLNALLPLSQRGHSKNKHTNSCCHRLSLSSGLPTLHDSTGFALQADDPHQR